ncbi:MAG: hypothetical protein ABWY57_05940 [Mycetocola sp.]
MMYLNHRRTENVVTADVDPVLTAPSRAGRAAIILAVVLIIAQGFLAIGLFFFVLDSGYDFDGDGGVDSYDKLPWLGDGPRSAFIVALLMPLLGGLFAFGMLMGRARMWAWTAPVIAMLISVALCQYFISTFESIPLTGG